jgi:hypothetical protein
MPLTRPTPESMDAADAPLFPTHRAQLWRTVQSTEIICLLIALLLTSMGMNGLMALTYSLAIGNLNAGLIHVGRFGLTRWQLRHGGVPSPAQREGWPGWGPMAGVIVLGVVVAYPLGSLLAEWLLGIEHAWTFSHLWAEWRAPLVISLFGAISATYYFHSRARLANAELALAQIGRQAAETQLRLLESQLEPHMLFNTLANLRALIAVDPARAQAMLDRMIDFLRATLNASRVGEHALADEFARIADYLALMQIRMGDRLQLALELPEALADARVPPLLLQPLVENAIKHGLEPQRAGGLLRVSADTPLPGVLRLCVADGGHGLQPQADAAPGGTRFGLAQVRERLHTLYGPQAQLALSPRPEGGTLACVQIPLRHAPAPAHRVPS